MRLPSHASRRMLAATAAVLLLVTTLGGCARSQPAATEPPATPSSAASSAPSTASTSPDATELAFAITSHHPGDTVSTPTVTVSGVASPGAEVVQDISFAPDERTTAAADGSWAISVTLDEGPNTLRFRVGDDRSTEEELTLTYAPPVAIEVTPGVVTPVPATPVAEFGLAHGSLGSSDLLEAYFTTEGFAFEDSPLTDGTQRRLGTSGVAFIELYGTPALTEVTVSAPLLLTGPDASTYASNLGRYLGAVIGSADGSKSTAITKWLQGLMKASGGLEDVDKTKTFGKLTVRFNWDATVLGMAFVDFTVAK